MRALIIAAVLAALGIGGFLAYQQMAPATEPQPGLFEAPAPSAPLPTARDCLTENAVYEYNDDRRLELRFRRMPSPAGGIEMSEFEGRRIGNMALVVRVTSFNSEYVFNPAGHGASGTPQYQSATAYVRPAGGGANMQVFFFDEDMHYINSLPRNDTPAPRYVMMNGMLPILYRDRIDQPPGVFRFQRCDTPPAAPAAAGPQ
jgi:hypothetical protein